MRKAVLKRIKPSRKEELDLKRVAKKVMDKIKIPNTKLELGGSSAKGTWLKGNHDIDIYVKFNQKFYSGINISETLQKKVRKATVVHGSRDYLQMEIDGYDIELIPILDIKDVEDAENITDISPFHKKWVRKHRKYVDDIRLAKAFAKANGLYGAESYIRGFSGYAIEVLTIYYGGFENLVINVAKWRTTRTTIDPENHHKGRVKLNYSKIQTPLIVVDPVQASRNVTAVVSKEKYILFKKAAKAFLKNPSDQFFVKRSFSLEELQKKSKDHKIVLVELEPLEGKRDVVGAKILKSFDFVKKELLSHEFTLKDAGWHWEDTALLWFTVQKQELSKKVKHYGPPKEKKERVKSFKKKWKGKRVSTEGNKTFVMIDRKYIIPEKLIHDIMQHQYVDSRISKVINQKTY